MGAIYHSRWGEQTRCQQVHAATIAHMHMLLLLLLPIISRPNYPIVSIDIVKSLEAVISQRTCAQG